MKKIYKELQIVALYYGLLHNILFEDRVYGIKSNISNDLVAIYYAHRPNKSIKYNQKIVSSTIAIYASEITFPTKSFIMSFEVFETYKNYRAHPWQFTKPSALLDFITKIETKITKINYEQEINEKLIHKLYLNILVKLDEDIKLQKEKDGIDLKRDKKVCLLLSKLIRELYGEEMETDNSYIFGSTKKECFKILKETILPSLDYKIDDGELNEIIDDCARKLSYENKERFEV